MTKKSTRSETRDIESVLSTPMAPTFSPVMRQYQLKNRVVNTQVMGRSQQLREKVDTSSDSADLDSS